LPLSRRGALQGTTAPTPLSRSLIYYFANTLTPLSEKAEAAIMQMSLIRSFSLYINTTVHRLFLVQLSLHLTGWLSLLLLVQLFFLRQIDCCCFSLLFYLVNVMMLFGKERNHCNTNATI